MFPRCAPNMASRQRSGKGSSVARRPIAADGRFMSNGSCPPSATTSARTSVNRRTRAIAATSKPGAGTAMTQANASRGASAAQRQSPRQPTNARRMARLKKPGWNAGKSLPEHKKPRLPVLPISIPIGRNVWRRHTGNSRKKTGGAQVETRKAGRHRAATKRKSVPMVLARQDPMRSQGLADRRATQNQLTGAGPEGAADPQKGALAANRDAPCALSAAG
jgi:hypothetical protein